MHGEAIMTTVVLACILLVVGVVVVCEGSSSTSCYVRGVSESYVGKMSWTVNQHTCQRWDTQEPHTHTYNTSRHFPGDGGKLPDNFCRVVDQPKPWCFTTHWGTLWEFCDVSVCDVNECLGEDHGCEQECVNTDGSYYCSCRPGYALEADNRTCSDVDECATDQGGCSDTCTDTVGSFTCSCPSGFVLEANARTCIDVDECSTDTHGCRTDIHMCVNDVGGFHCACQTGYKFTENGKDCEDIKECEVEADNRCAHKCIEQSPGFKCDCNPGFYLEGDQRTCTDTDECSTDTHDCTDLCINDAGSYHCACLAGYQFTDDAKECEDIDECTTNRGGCSDTCTNTRGSFTCSCPSGFVLEADDRTCFEYDPRNTPCTPAPGGGKCQCPPGLVLATDALYCLDPCVLRPCLHGGTCSVTPTSTSGYTCDCSVTEYSGSHCQLGYITFSAQHMSADVGNTSPTETLYADVTSQLLVTSKTDDVTLIPSPVIITSPAKSATFQVKSKERGKRVMNFELGGGDADKFDNKDDLTVTGTDVFSKNVNKTSRFTLPEGCFTVSALTCSGLDVMFTSTLPWYILKSDPKIAYTYGTVFMKANDVSLPASIAGWEVQRDTSKHIVSLGRLSNARQVSDGTIVGGSEECKEIETNKNDLGVYIKDQTLFKTFLLNVVPKQIAAFLKVLPNPKAPVQSRFTMSLQTSEEIQRIPSCRGAPTLADTTYAVFRYNHGTRIDVVGKIVDIPPTQGNEEYCLLIDLCHDFGTTIMALFPTSSQQLLRSIPIINSLSVNAGINIVPRGLGLSTGHWLDVSSKVGALEFWNGDEMFTYPINTRATVWLGADVTKTVDKTKTFDYYISGTNDIFMRLPNLQTFLTGMFIEETNILLKLGYNTGGHLHFKIGDTSHTIPMMDMAVFSGYMYASVGGPAREWCGSTANPPGVFLKMALDVTAFRGIPLLEHLVLKGQVTVFGFITFDSLDNVTGFSPSRAYQTTLRRIKRISTSFLHLSLKEVGNIMTQVDVSELDISMDKLKDAISNLKDEIIQISVDDIKSMRLPNISKIMTAIREQFSDLRDIFLKLKDSAEITFQNSLKSILTCVESELRGFASHLEKLIKEFTDNILGYFTKDRSFGLKMHFSLSLFGIKFPEIEGEVVYSDRNLARCHRSDFVFDQLKGVKAYRGYGQFIFGAPIISEFFKIGAGFGIEFAGAVDTDKWVLGFHAKFMFLGLNVKSVVYISEQSLLARVDASIFNFIRASIEAKIVWPDPARRKKRNSDEFKLQVQASFLQFSSLGDAIRQTMKKVTDSAMKRLDEADNAMKYAQSKVRGANNDLDGAKAKIDKGYAAFDDACDVLEGAKGEVRKARGPFEAAIKKLNNAQRNLDNLCTIRSCPTVCIPGLKGSWCSWGWVKGPCLEWTNCMIEIYDPGCVLANVGCHILRGAAYVVLEAAKLFVRIPLLALDVAEGILTASQFIVDKAKVVLEIAKGVLTVAQGVLHVVDAAISVARFALQALKVTLKLALLAFDWIIKNILQNIVDVRKCGIAAEISVSSWFRFTVGCEVSTFGSEFRKLSFTIDFKKPLMSIWNAAKTIVTHAIKTFFGGRKRRDVSDTVVEWTETELVFAQLCDKYKVIHKFLREAITCLFDAANETVHTLAGADNRTTSSMINVSPDPEERGINTTDALLKYNITRERVIQLLNQTEDKEEIKNLREVLKSVDDKNNKTTDTVRNFCFVPQWKDAMENMTKDSFEDYPDSCSSFSDCVSFAIDQLDINYKLIDSLLVEPIMPKLVKLRLAYKNLLNATSSNATTLMRVSQEILHLIDSLQGDVIFCAHPPTITTPLENAAVRAGSDHTIVCMAEGYNVAFVWVKDEETIANETTHTYTIANASIDDAGYYRCEVSNHVGYTNSSGYISVQEMPVVTSVLPTELTIVRGERIDISCNASGVPPPDITWVSTSSIAVPPGPRLLITSPSPAHAGIYHCKATNIHGTASSPSLAIKVHDVTVACPRAEITIGFVTVAGETEKFRVLIVSPGPLTWKFQFAFITMLSGMQPTVRVSDVRVGSTSVTCVLSRKCSTYDKSIHPNDANTQYQERVGEITEAVDLLMVSEPDVYLFRHGHLYATNPAASVKYGEIVAVCPDGTVAMETHPHACELLCPSGWRHHGTSCYRYMSCRNRASCTTNKARADCERRNAFLATIRSDDDNEFVTSLPHSHVATLTIFIGATRVNEYHRATSIDIIHKGRGVHIRLRKGGRTGRDHERHFRWADGTEMVYTNWRHGEPNDYDGGEDCVEIKRDENNKWNDNKCYIERDPDSVGYVCQMKQP